MLLEKILLGITLSAPIGPVSLEMIKRGLNKGFLSAFVVRLGGAMGNTLCLVGTYFGIGYLLNSDFKLGIASLFGSLVLLYMGSKSLLDKRKHDFKRDENAAFSVRSGLSTGFILSIANPIGIMFWIGIFAATLDTTTQTQNWAGLFENFSIILGVLLWGLFLSTLCEIGKRTFNQTLIKIITIIAGVMLIGFGLKYGYKAVLLFQSL